MFNILKIQSLDKRTVANLNLKLKQVVFEWRTIQFGDQMITCFFMLTVDEFSICWSWSMFHWLTLCISSLQQLMSSLIVKASAHFIHWIHNTIHRNKHNISKSILDAHVDPVTCLSALKWKTDQSKIKFALLNLFPSNASHSQKETAKVLFISLPLALISFSCQRNPVKLPLCAIKKHKKYLKTKPS